MSSIFIYALGLFRRIVYQISSPYCSVSSGVKISPWGKCTNQNGALVKNIDFSVFSKPAGAQNVICLGHCIKDLYQKS